METPEWLDRNAYPFASHYLSLPNGRLHYLDEGQGEVLLFVHGTPTWSFLWRRQIKELSSHYRCLALDHLGFGLSDKPEDFSYSLEAHRHHLELLVQHLQLKQVTLVVHDFGGPIGLGWAVRNPEKIKNIVVLNSWMWPLHEEKTMLQASKFFGSSIGEFLYRQLNFSPKVLLPQAFYQKEKLTKAIHQQYIHPFQKKKDRMGTWVFAKALAGEGTYFDELYAQRHALLGKPIMILWGRHDKLIPASFLEKWLKVVPAAKVIEVESGHFLQEEAPLEVTKAIQEFMAQQNAAKSISAEVPAT